MNDKGPLKHVLGETPLEAGYKLWSFVLDTWSKITACLLAPIALISFNQKYWWATTISVVSIMIMWRYLYFTVRMYWKQNFYIIPDTLKVMFTKHRHRKEYAPIVLIICDMGLLIGSAIGVFAISVFIFIEIF